MFENAFRIENELLLFENYFDLKAISEVYKDIIDYYDKESNDKLKEYYTEKYKNVLHKLKTNFSSYNIIRWGIEAPTVSRCKSKAKSSDSKIFLSLLYHVTLIPSCTLALELSGIPSLLSEPRMWSMPMKKL